MKRIKVKEALVEVGYSHDSIKSLLCGRSLPSMSKAILLKQNNNIPISAWEDIKTYINPTPKEVGKPVSS